MEEKKELSLDLLNEIDKEYEEKEEITVFVKTKDGKVESKLMIDKYFNPTKIRDCIKELIQKIDYAKNYITDDRDQESLYKILLMLMLVKYFTTLDIPFAFKKQVAVLEKLSETQVLYQIFSSFNQKEVEKVIDELERFTTILMKKVDIYQPVINEAESNIKSMKKK